MTFKTYEINVDLVHDSSTISTIQFSQNDRNSAKLLLTITNKGTELDLSQAKSIRMSFKKPDGTRVFQNDCQPVNALKGEYQILLKTQTLAAVGTVIAQIHIEEEDRTIDTQKFFFIVSDSLASDKAIESTNEFTIIQKAIEAGEKLEGVDINGIIAAGAKADGALPKTGGTMTGLMTFANTRGLEFLTPTSKFTIATSTSESNPNRLYMYDSINNKTVWDYNANNGGLWTFPGETNLLKTTGGTMTGEFKMSRPNGTTARSIKWDTNGVGDIDLGMGSTGKWLAWDPKNAKVIYAYDPTTQTFNVDAPNTNLVTKAKDGRVDLVLTADVENFNGNVGPIADRYGNTVTFRAGLRRKVGATGTLVTTLPTDMRPTMTVFSTTVSNDGVPARVVVNSNGDVHLENAGVATISGKDVYIAITYVVK